MKENEIREGDIVEIDYIAEFTKEHINEGKALVIWKGFNHQPLVRKLNTKVTIWTGYEHIARVVDHIDLEGYMDKTLLAEPCEDCISREAVIEWLKTKDIIKLSSQEETAKRELKALSSVKPQEPCEDCISRQATVERLCKVAEFMNEKRNGLGSPYIMAALFIQDNKDEFPSVTPKPKTDVLDKIRAEIKEVQTYKMFEGEDTVYVERKDVLAIIDKCTEEKECGYDRGRKENNDDTCRHYQRGNQ